MKPAEIAKTVFELPDRLSLTLCVQFGDIAGVEVAASRLELADNEFWHAMQMTHLHRAETLQMNGDNTGAREFRLTAARYHLAQLTNRLEASLNDYTKEEQAHLRSDIDRLTDF